MGKSFRIVIPPGIGYNVIQGKRKERKINLADLHLIHIFGSSGSGSTTFARAIAETHGFHHIDTDDALWIPTDPPFTRKRTPEEAKAIILRQLGEHERCVISGEFLGWGDFLRDRVDLYVYMNLTAEIRIERVQNREVRRFGSRVLPGGDMYRAHLEFLDWVKSYESDSQSHRSRMAHLKKIAALEKPVLRIEEPLPVTELLRKIEPFLS